MDQDDDKQKRDSLISALENSRSFANTHTLIKELNRYKTWEEGAKERLFCAAINNQQIRWILSDSDVKSFYKQLLTGEQKPSQTAQEVQTIIENGNDTD